MGIFHILTAVLVVLKLIGTITCSWWIVLAPSLIPLGVALLVLLIGGLALKRFG